MRETSAAMTTLCGKAVTLLLTLFALVAPLRAEPNHIAATLVAESPVVAPRGTVMLAIDMRPEPGWHGYWKNPGEAGFEPRFEWRGDLKFGKPLFPVPQSLVVGGLMNYVYEGPHALLVPVSVPESATVGTVMPVTLKLDYLVCTDKICVPERALLSTTLTVGEPIIDPALRARFDGWRAKLPTPLGSQARFERADGKLRLAIPFPAAAELREPHFFPGENGLIVDSGAQSFTRGGDLLIVEAPLGSGAGAVAGVLAIGQGRGLTISALPGPVPVATTSGGFATILLALGGAILGGLILNVMPCVFPIIGLKAMSLAKAGGGERVARRDALGYTLGAVMVCVGLGAAILALRAGGSAVGWAFQLQDPRVIVVLLVLVTAIALNLAGLFELPTVGGNLASSNSVATGALAAFVATPCTGPFMGAALGAALVLPTAAALAVFAGLGLGLALPFLALGFVPALRQRLPRPGAWMSTLRRVLSVPMFATALGLVWLLGRQAGSDAAAVGLAGALIAALVLWWAGLRQGRGRGGLALAGIAALVAAAVTAVLLPVAPVGAAAPSTLAAEPFSEERLAALRAEHRPVFVYFTADWCLTCKVNERVAIERPEVAAAFKAGGIAALVGDWTRADPAIGRFLAAQGRSGVPLYLFYSRDGEAQTLPQVLMPATLTALGK